MGHQLRLRDGDPGPNRRPDRRERPGSREEQALVDGDAGAGAGPRREGVVSGCLGGLAPRQCAPPRFVVVGRSCGRTDRNGRWRRGVGHRRRQRRRGRGPGDPEAPPRAWPRGPAGQQRRHRGPVGPTWEIEPDRWWRTMEVNLRGTLLCTQLVLPEMVHRRRGRIVNISSHAGVFRWPLVSAYSVSKAAVAKLTENLARETHRHGVSVFSVHPGLLRPTAAAPTARRTDRMRG